MQEYKTDFHLVRVEATRTFSLQRLSCRSYGGPNCSKNKAQDRSQ